MKQAIKYYLIIFLSALSIFYKCYDLNIILLIPLLTFFMSNGIKNFLFSLIGIILGSIILYEISNEYISIVYMLISISLLFVLYHFFLLINKKIIINYLLSTFLAIISTYIIYMYSFKTFDIINFLHICGLSLLICFIFAYLLKKFSLYLLEFIDKQGSILLASLINLYLLNINIISEYIAIGIVIISICYYISEHETTYSLSMVACFILLSILYNFNIVINNLLLIMLISFALSIKLIKNKVFNMFLLLSCFIVNYFLNNKINITYYLILSILTSLSMLFINIKSNNSNEDIYYNQYIKNKKLINNHLDNIENMFVNISSSFNNSYQNEILRKCKEEVFDTMCCGCDKLHHCYKKDKHILLNYIKDLLNDTLDDSKINNIKKSCLRHETYFTLLDKFTKTYLINNYKSLDSSKTKEIVSADFYSFANIINKCKTQINNDRLDKINSFYLNLKEELKQHKYDVLFVKNMSNDTSFIFDIAIKNISINKFKNKVIPIINELLDSYMKVYKVDYTTLTFNYLIISIKEIEKLNISYHYRQSNEDVNANGDSYSLYQSDKQFYVAISDGMGNGMKANEESKFSLDTLFSMIKTKMDVKSSIVTANDLIRLKNEYESYSTLDLLAINKYSHIASFYKLGAISSFIIRDHGVTSVNNYSLPLGILDDVLINPSSYKLKKKDIIVMCSDGMIDDNNLEVTNILENISYDKPDIICNMLFSQLMNIRKNIDDATIIVITIN